MTFKQTGTAPVDVGKVVCSSFIGFKGYLCVWRTSLLLNQSNHDYIVSLDVISHLQTYPVCTAANLLILYIFKKKKKKGLQMTANAFNWFPGLTSASSSGFQGFSKALTTSLCHAIITHKTCKVSSLQLNDRQHQIQSLTAVWLMRNCQKVTEIDSRGRDLLFLL